MLRKSFSDFLAKECTSDLVKEWFNNERGYSPAIWKKMADLGWMELICEAVNHKSGTNFLDAVILFEEAGKALLPSPLFISAATAGLILSHIENDNRIKKYISGISEGKKIFSVGLFNEKGRYDHCKPCVEAVPEENGKYRITGIRLFVPYANSADFLLICADVKDKIAGEPTLFAIRAGIAGLTVRPMNTLYPERKCEVEFKNMIADSSDIVGKIGLGARYVDDALCPAIVLKCGEMLGGMRQVFNTTVQYAKDRHQFGKPLGVLQAVQHHCADMATLYEGARLLTYQAASLISNNMACEKETAMAKAWVSDAYKKCTWIAHQIHGAIGFTEEYPLHLYYRHAKENELMMGDSRHHRAELIRQMEL
jgi:alkylation response protein AidB-like acyl-CoA dehydrogenase